MPQTRAVSLEGHTLVFSLEHPAQLLAPTDTELRIDAREMSLDGLQRDIELVCDLAIRASLECESRDSQLPGSKRLHTCAPNSPGPGAGRAELLARFRRKRASRRTGQRDLAPRRAARAPRHAHRHAAARPRTRSANEPARAAPGTPEGRSPIQTAARAHPLRPARAPRRAVTHRPRADVPNTRLSASSAWASSRARSISPSRTSAIAAPERACT